MTQITTRRPHALIGLTFDIHLLAREPINALALSLHVFGAGRLLSPIGEARTQNMKHESRVRIYGFLFWSTLNDKRKTIRRGISNCKRVETRSSICASIFVPKTITIRITVFFFSDQNKKKWKMGNKLVSLFLFSGFLISKTKNLLVVKDTGR